jgi:hypothetical protein
MAVLEIPGVNTKVGVQLRLSKVEGVENLPTVPGYLHPVQLQLLNAADSNHSMLHEVSDRLL